MNNTTNPNVKKKKLFRKYILLGILFLLLLRCIDNAVFGGLPRIDADDELLHLVESPDGKKTVAVYLHNGGATVCWSVHCRVYGEDILDRPFFRLYHGDSAEITWLDENHIFIEATTCGNERYWKDVLPAGSTGITLDVRGEWYDNGDFGGIGRDENGKLFLHKWWRN